MKLSICGLILALIFQGISVLGQETDEKISNVNENIEDAEQEPMNIDELEEDSIDVRNLPMNSPNVGSSDVGNGDGPGAEPSLGNEVNPPVPQKAGGPGEDSILYYLEPFVYQGEQERNPFDPVEEEAPLDRGEVYGPFLPLQTARLSAFTLKGLFWNTSRPVALVEDGKGDLHRVGIKDYLGENYGYVASIREKEVVIIQTVEEGDSRYSRTKVLFLNKKGSKQ